MLLFMPEEFFPCRLWRRHIHLSSKYSLNLILWFIAVFTKSRTQCCTRLPDADHITSGAYDPIDQVLRLAGSTVLCFDLKFSFGVGNFVCYCDGFAEFAFSFSAWLCCSTFLRCVIFGYNVLHQHILQRSWPSVGYHWCGDEDSFHFSVIFQQVEVLFERCWEARHIRMPVTDKYQLWVSFDFFSLL